jgi:hypothetical protein
VTGEPGAASYRIKLRRFCPSAWFARLYRLSCQHRSWTETEQGLALIALSVTTHGSQIKTLCVRQFLSQVDHLVEDRSASCGSTVVPRNSRPHAIVCTQGRLFHRSCNKRYEMPADHQEK